MMEDDFVRKTFDCNVFLIVDRDYVGIFCNKELAREYAFDNSVILK